MWLSAEYDWTVSPLVTTYDNKRTLVLLTKPTVKVKVKTSIYSAQLSHITRVDPRRASYAPNRSWYSFTDQWRTESWVGSGGATMWDSDMQQLSTTSHCNLTPAPEFGRDGPPQAVTWYGHKQLQVWNCLAGLQLSFIWPLQLVWKMLFFSK
jgi:hypothetical protein